MCHAIGLLARTELKVATACAVALEARDAGIESRIFSLAYYPELHSRRACEKIDLLALQPLMRKVHREKGTEWAPELDSSLHLCLFDLWDLPHDRHIERSQRLRVIHTPSVDARQHQPDSRLGPFYVGKNFERGEENINPHRPPRSPR